LYSLGGSEIAGIIVALLLVAALTALLVAGRAAFAELRLDQVTMVYLVPVLVAATLWGIRPALVAGLAGIAASDFFFYPPIYDFGVHRTEDIIDVLLFAFVAVVTGQLAASVRKARLRSEADALREALIGSVSHELRTPLSSILGAASVLGQSRELAQDPRLSGLVQALGEEAARLDEHIQKLLDATRISSEGIRPRADWVDPGDIVSAAVEHKRRLLAGHDIMIQVADNLPMLHVDSTIVERSLGQFIENAAKYSPSGSRIEITAEHVNGSVRLAVTDHGSGLSREERERIWERSYRSPRHRDSVPGSGLGLWIARSLALACGATVEASSGGIGQGATLAIRLPVQEPARPGRDEEFDA
jgi:K+-sensing histidine kinase KdpD